MWAGARKRWAAAKPAPPAGRLSTAGGRLSTASGGRGTAPCDRQGVVQPSISLIDRFIRRRFVFIWLKASTGAACGPILGLFGGVKFDTAQCQI